VRFTVALIYLCLPLGGCGDGFKQHVQERVKAQMIDPQSAQFSDDWYDSHRDIACGEVNGRNRFGGYAGRRLWAWGNGRAMIAPDVGEDVDNRFNNIWMTCWRARYPDQAAADNLLANMSPDNGM